MTEGFEKIEITSATKNNKKSVINQSLGTNRKEFEMKRKNKMPVFIKIIGAFLISLILLTLIVVGISYKPIKNSISGAKKAYANAKIVYDFIKKQDVVKAGEKLKETKLNILETQKNLKSISWMKSLPLIGNYYKDANHAANAAFYGVEAAQIALDAIIPHADLLGLKGQGSFVAGSAEERIQKTVQTMDKLTPKIGDVENKLNLIKKEIDQIDTNRYPEAIVGKKLNSQLSQARKLIDESSLAIADAKPILETLPKLLGEPDPKKYLIIFQNDKELRSTGGFITAYAVFRMEHGKINLESSDDIYKLDDSRTIKVAAPEAILKYLPLVPYWNLRDSNISPDFKVSMENFEKLYDSSSEKAEIDGIIALDTNVLLKIMEVLGPIEIYGTKFTTDTVPECNCPHVIYELERYADQPVGYAKGGRKDLIGVLMRAIMQKSLSSSPKLYWGRLFQVGIEQMNQKHILVYLHDPKAQKGMESLNFSGRIKDFGGDYLHVNDTNFAGAKSNMYVKHEIDEKIEKQSDGSIIKTLTLKYKNPQVASNCNLEKGELCLNGLLRNWLRVYVPKGSELIESKGSEVKVKSYEDLGKTVFEGFVQVRPQGSAQVTLKYKLPFIINNEQDLRLLIQKQPGTLGHKYTIESAGKIQEFELTTDKELKIKL